MGSSVGSTDSMVLHQPVELAAVIGKVKIGTKNHVYDYTTHQDASWLIGNYAATNVGKDNARAPP